MNPQHGGNAATQGLDVRHDAARNRFEIALDGGVAHCDYQRRGDVLLAHHTEVPAAHRGRGVAARLVAALVDHARAHRLKIEPACPYVASYMRKHADTQALLA